MIDHHTPDAVTPAPRREDHQTVIKFVLSGPILGGHEAEVSQIGGPSTEVTELRERMDALERALGDADARIDALSRALAATVAGVAATGNRSSRHTERPPKAAQPAPQSAAPSEPIAERVEQVQPEQVQPEHVQLERIVTPDAEPAAPQPVAPEPVAPQPVATVALAQQPVAPEPIAAVAYAAQAVATEPVAAPPYAMAGAAKPDLSPLALVAQPATRAPALRSSHPTPPKVRALRRVISVLKHL